MYIERIPNRNSPPAVLLRESYREGGKVKKRTLANLSKLPDEVVDNLKLALKGATAIKADQLPENLEIIRSLPHGHVSAILKTLKKLGLDKIIDGEKSRERSLIEAMIVARIINPASKLATARGFDEDTCTSSIGKVLGIEKAHSNELYEALDYLLSKQTKIESKLAQKHLKDGSLILYDVTSTYVEGEHCPLAQYGYNRDKKKGKAQIIFGLITDKYGRPIAVEVFEGNVLDNQTLSQQIEKVKERFKLNKIVWISDRGILTDKNINELIKKKENIDWITALTKTQVRLLAEKEQIQLGIFDQRNLIEITSDLYPEERLIVCRNPLVAESNKIKRAKLIEKTEEELNKIVLATTREKRKLKGKEKIGLRVGKVINKFKVAKYFELDISEERFNYNLKEEVIAQEEKLDGIYIIRTSVSSEEMDSISTVKNYKSLSKVEFAFRCYKTIDLNVRPIYHWKTERVKGHIFLCMLAYYVEWHMKEKLKSMLFEDEELEVISEENLNFVISKSAKGKKKKKRNKENDKIHSFRTLLSDLGTITLNKIRANLNGKEIEFDKVTKPTLLQEKILKLLGVSLYCTQ
jgi:transposase